MPSRVAVPQAREEVATGKHKAINTDANRRALGDIGNVVDARFVAEGKAQQQISRPITRSFGAQLLAKAQAAATNKKILPPVAPVVAQAAAATKVAVPNKADVTAKPKKILPPVAPVVAQAAATKVAVPNKADVTAKPKVETVIQISPDTNEDRMKTSSHKKVSKNSSRKKVHTLTHVLTERSKHACGLNDNAKGKKEHDIDSADGDDQLAVAEYVEDIYKFYRMAEDSSQVPDYMDSQTEINSKMREILSGWLVEVHLKFELMPETLYLTMHIIDRYLSVKQVSRRDLQLVGVTAMLIACKYEEIWAPEVNDFVCISDRAYSREQILMTEKTILNYLEWGLTVPTPYVFLLRFLKAAASDKQMENLVFFFAEMSLIHYSMIAYRPSMIAASAVYAARCTLGLSPSWTDVLKKHTSYSEQQIRDCARQMVLFHVTAADNKLKVVYKKYSSAQLGSVSLLPPASKLLAETTRAIAANTS